MTALWRAYRRWRDIAGPLADYVLPAPFLAPWSPRPRLPAPSGAAGVVRALVALAGAPSGTGAQRSEAGGDGEDEGEGVAVFFEAPPRLGLAVGLRLGHAGWRVAPLFGRWPAPGAVLPAERLTGWLVGVAGALHARGTRRVRRAPPRRPPLASGTGGATGRAGPLCLLLDAQRASRASPEALRRRFDNRYDYPAFLLPPPARIRAWGAGRAIWAGPAAAVPPDLQDYAAGLAGAGILLDLVRLPAGRSAVGRPGVGRPAR